MCFFDIGVLPKLNLSNPEARNHVVEAALYWLEAGLDGYRLDHVVGPPHNFWLEFVKSVKSRFCGAVLIGEASVWVPNLTSFKTLGLPGKHIKWLRHWWTHDPAQQAYDGLLDGVLDYELYFAVRRYIEKSSGKLNFESLRKKIERHYLRYSTNFLLPTFLDNHDTERILLLCRNDKERLKEAARFQFSLNQPAIIYYGTEVGMTQRQRTNWGRFDGSDIYSRQPMIWNKTGQDPDLLEFYTTLIAARSKR